MPLRFGCSIELAARRLPPAVDENQRVVRPETAQVEAAADTGDGDALGSRHPGCIHREIAPQEILHVDGAGAIDRLGVEDHVRLHVVDRARQIHTGVGERARAFAGHLNRIEDHYLVVAFGCNFGGRSGGLGDRCEGRQQ